MPKFSSISLHTLQLVHPKLADLCKEVIKFRDFRVLDGIRDPDEQRRHLASGASKTLHSKHLPQRDGLAHAVDLIRWPVDWAALERGLAALRKVDPEGHTAEAYEFIGFMQGFAAAKGIKLRSGSDWDMDTDVSDQTFNDIPHHELRP
jgi:peptidoglycan L-alanyl-D-glutamate endopeptidase CwlK